MRAFKQRDKQAHSWPTAIEILEADSGPWTMTEQERTKMTASCRDTDYIKKVKDAGQIKRFNNTNVQVMHNGLIVKSGGYYGEWMNEIIRSLRGHHEPQEEKVFYEVLKRLDKDATMIELGSFWAYYSLWFNKEIEGARNICCEPDPHNIAVGEMNAELNNASGIRFIRSAAGKEDGSVVKMMLESSSAPQSVVIRTADGLKKEAKWEQIDLLHIDVQGHELEALEGARESIQSKKLRFLFVSTHHYSISKNPNMHKDCLKFIENNGGSVISSHTIPESFSGDGLIVASFSTRDKNFKVDTSLNHTDKSLFRPYEEDLAILWDAYNRVIGETK